MAGKPTNQTKPTRPVNQWVKDAVAFSGLSQAELGRRLVQQGVISNDDRSIVNKMTTIRNVSHEEAVAISRITGYPIEKMGIDGRLAIGFTLLTEDQKIEVLSYILEKVSQQRNSSGIPDTDPLFRRS